MMFATMTSVRRTSNVRDDTRAKTPTRQPLSGGFGTLMGFCRASIFTDATHFT